MLSFSHMKVKVASRPILLHDTGETKKNHLQKLNVKNCTLRTENGKDEKTPFYMQAKS